jgi:small subunit ribosomal protein S2
MATTVNIQSLLGAAVHFGHQTRRWNPKMKPYIFGDRNGIYSIDLKRTLIELDKAYTFVNNLAAKGGKLLFVGTKKQAQEPVSSNATRCGMPYVNSRWLGGMLTNFVTIRSRVTYMEQLEAMEKDGRMATLPKKEQILLRKELVKLQTNLNGVRNMTSAPDAIFVVDTKREEIAIHEAHRLGIPVIGIIDTNADPDEVDFGIPGNDDAIRSVNLMCEVIADAVIAGSTGGGVTAEDMSAAAPAPEAKAEAPAAPATQAIDAGASSEPVAAIAETVGDAAEALAATAEAQEVMETSSSAAPDAEAAPDAAAIDTAAGESAPEAE